jgi:TorA maturation chaperone TorD
MAFPSFPLPNSTILTDKVSEFMSLSNRVEGQFFYQVPQGSQLQQFLSVNQKRSVVIVARVIQQTDVNTALSMNITSVNTEN